MSVRGENVLKVAMTIKPRTKSQFDDVVNGTTLSTFLGVIV